MTTILRTKPTIYYILLLAMGLFFSCQKELSSENTTLGFIPTDDLVTKIPSSVSGFVTDENNAIVPGAVVQFGTGSAITDKYGFFEFADQIVIQNAAVVKVSMPGYFTAVKTFIATKGKSGFFRIKLIPKKSVGTINALTGGSVTASGNLTITLPANSVINASTGVNHNGVVNVSAFWIDPVADELHKLMPGDLRGIDSTGRIKHLTTYGMAAIELTGSSGEQLQISPGKKATLIANIPASIVGNAPTTLPLWYFDDAKGLWKEEGTAVKVGNSYEGEVSHFSYWNYDTPANCVLVSGTFISPKGLPVRNALIKISSVADPHTFSIVYTDASGFFLVAIRQNTNWKMEILGESNCSSAIYTKLISSTTTPLSLGSIILNLITSIGYVSGTALDCNNAPVTNGYLIMIKDNLLYRYPLSPFGSFSYSTLLCNGNSAISLIAENSGTQQQGSPLIHTITSGENQIGNLIACGTSTVEFVHYAIDGVPGTFDAPVDTIWQAQSIYFAVVGRRKLPTVENLSASFDTIGMRLGSLQNLIGCSGTMLPGPSFVPTPVKVQITEFGNIGQYVSGNFSGNIQYVNPPNRIYHIDFSFRVRRIQ